MLQILLNLLSNAIKFSKYGNKVCIESKQCGKCVCLKITDNGIGILANQLASITQPFEQVFFTLLASMGAQAWALPSSKSWQRCMVGPCKWMWAWLSL